MRLVAGVLSLALFAPFARAEDTPTPPAPPPPAPAPVPAPPAARVPFRVVRVMPDTRQALLFDRGRNTHVLAEVGGKLDGYTIEDIDDETVRLRRDNQEVVLAAPLHGADRRRDREPVYVRSASAAAPITAAGPPGPPGPIDPYGDPPPRPAGDPTAHAPALPVPGDALPAEPGIRVAHAPDTLPPPATAPVVVPGDGGVRVAVAPDVGPAVSPAPGPSAAPGSTGPAVSAAPTAAGPAAIRVVSATLGAAPAASSAPAAAPGAAPATPSASGPGAPDRLSREIAEPFTTLPRAPVAASEPAPAAKPAEVRAADAARAPDKQTADARALADILTADRPTRSPRAPAELPGAPTRAAEVRPAATPPAPPAPGDAVALSRGELDSALADFARLAAGVHGSFSSTGAVIDGVGDGTIFQRAGLRAGDVVTSVDGVRLRTLDDAANLYARASTARAITAQILRAGKPITLRVVIQ